MFSSKKFHGCSEKATPKLETRGMSSWRTTCSCRAVRNCKKQPGLESRVHAILQAALLRDLIFFLLGSVT